MKTNTYNPYKSTAPTAMDLYRRREASKAYAKSQAEIKHAQQEYQRMETLRLQQEREQRKIEEEARRKEEARKNAGFFERVGSTLGELGGNLVGGVLKFGEGIVDAGATLVGGVGGLFDKGFQNKVQDFVKNDWVGDNYTPLLADMENLSYLSDGAVGRTIRGVAQGVGQNLPAIALSLVPYVGPALSAGAFIGSASGNYTEEAFKEGATYGQGAAYGLLGGLVEGGTEALTGGIGGTQAGKVLGRQLGKSTLGKLGITMLGEGVEEVISDLANPALKRITGVDKDATVDWGQLPETFLVGGLTGVALGGGSRAVSALQNRKVGGYKGLNAIETMDHLNTVNADINLLQQEGKLTAKKESKMQLERDGLSQRLQATLDKMKPEHRAELIRRYERTGLFDGNGNVIGLSSKNAAPIDHVGSVTRDQLVLADGGTETGVSHDHEANVKTYSPDAYTAALRGREDTLAYKPTSSVLTEEQKSAVKNVVKLRDGKTNVVITDGLAEHVNGLYSNGVLYISSRADAPMTIAGHELTHSLEGTKEYEKFAAYVMKALPKEVRDLEIAKRMKLYEQVNTGYSEATKRYEAETEYVAEVAGRMLSGQAVIDRVAVQNRNLAVRIYTWIKQRLRGELSSEGRKFFKKAERLYAKALSNGVGGVSLDDVEKTLIKADAETRAVRKRERAQQYSLKDSIKTLDGYSELERGRILANKMNAIAEKYEDIIDFIKNAKKSGLNKNLYIGKIGKDLANQIKASTDLNTLGYYISLNSSDVYHIFNEHGESLSELSRGQVPVTVENALDVIDTMLSPDNIKHDIDAKSGVSSIIFEKSIDGKITAVTVLSNKKTRLTLKTAWINKKSGALSPTAQSAKSGKSSTSETLRGTHSTTDSIRQNLEKSTVSAKNDGNKKRYSLNDKSLRIEKAVRNFGTTTDFREAGYLLTDGRLLNFSGEPHKHFGYRGEDHRAISEVFEESELGGSASDGLIAFMKEGNIRMQPETPGLDISVMPTEKQISVIKRYVNYSLMNDGMFFVDFSRLNGDNVDSIEYGENTNANKVISDILYFFKNGKAPVKSEVSDFRYSLADFSSQVDAALANQLPKGDAVLVMKTTPDYLVKIGLHDLPMLITQKHLRNIHTIEDGSSNHFHGLSVEQIKRLPEMLRSPAMVFESLTVEGNIVVVTTEVDGEKRPIIIAVQPDGHGYCNHVDLLSNFITSFYGKDSFRLFLQKNLDQNKLLFADKEKSRTLLDSIRLQLPQVLTTYDSNTIIRKISQKSIVSANKINGDARYSLSSDALQYQKEVEQYKAMIVAEAQRAREIADRKEYVSAAVLNNESMLGFLKTIAGFKVTYSKKADGVGGRKLVYDIKRDVRQRVVDFGKYYNESNALLFDEDSPENSIFDPTIADAIDYISENVASDKPLNLVELRALYVIERGILHLYKNYDKVFRHGKYVSTGELAMQGLAVLQKTQAIKRGNGFMQIATGKLRELSLGMLEPSSVFLTLDGFNQDGMLTKLFDDIKSGEIIAANDLIDLMIPFEEFNKKHNNFAKKLTNVVTAANVGMTLDKAMTLYLTALRPQSNMYEAGFTVEDNLGHITKHSITQADVTNLYDSFDAETKEYIILAHDFFNEHARKLKEETDQRQFGYTNTEDGNNYIPVTRDTGGIARNISDVKAQASDIMTVHNFSFNKAMKKNVNIPVFINGLSSVVDKHARGVSMYHGLSIPMKNFSRVYNRKIGEKWNATSMREELTHRIWNGGEAYIKKLFNDIQGVKGERTLADKTLNWLRGSYSKFQLGFNPKTILSQLSSYPTAFVYLDADSLAKGAVMKADRELMFKHAPITRARMYDATVVKAQGLVDHVGKIGDVATKPIQMMDNYTVKRLWGACQAQVEKNTGAKIGTEENLAQAGELLTKVVRETQSNSIITERSGMSRSSNFVVSSMTMFMADATKQFSRLYNAIGTLSAYKTLAKQGDKSAIAKVAEAKKLLARTVAAVVVSNLVYTLIGLLFKYLYNKPEEEKTVGAFFKDFGGSMAGMIPFVRDIYGYFADDYDINNYAYGMIGDSLEAFKSMKDLFSDMISGKPMTTSEILAPTRKMLYAFGQFTGIPFRNAYNVIYGTVHTFSPAKALSVKTLFYNNKTDWRKMFDQSVANGDEESAVQYSRVHLAQLGWKDESVVREIGRLAYNGEEAFPRAKSEKISVDGTEYVLNGVQQQRIAQATKKAEQEVARLIADRNYKPLSNKTKATAIKFIQSANYHSTVTESTGVVVSSKRELVGKLIGVSRAALLYARASEVKATEKKTRAQLISEMLSTMGLTETEKLLLMSAMGYKVDTEKLERLIKASRLNDAEKATL